MTDRRRWICLLVVSSLVLAFLMQVPQLLHQMDRRSQGIMVRLNEDEEVYLARVQEGLSGRPEQSAEAYIGDPKLIGAQSALVERVYGTLFSWTDWRAAHVLQLMDSIVPVGIFVALIAFFRLCGFNRRIAFVGALLFLVLQFDGLNRPVQQRSGTLLTLIALCGILHGLHGRVLFGVLGGAILGILIGVYFWSFTFAWAWFALLILWESVIWFRSRRQETSFLRLRLLGLYGAAALFTAIPFILDYLEVMWHPLSEAGVFRSGMYHSRLPESWPYSILFAGMLVGVLGAFRQAPHERDRYIGGILFILTSFIVIHQQVVHGIVFNFVSHYLFLLVIAAISMLLFAWSLRSRFLLFAALCAAVYLSGIAYDERHMFDLFRVEERAFAEQHFAGALPTLDTLPRSMILSDPESSLFLAAYTKHDVAYSIRLKNVLMCHEEIAERYCLTQLPVSVLDRRIADNPLLIYPDANRAFKDPRIRAREMEMVEEACARFDRDPRGAIERYGVTHVFWNEKHHPEWDMDRLGPMKLLERGEGWSLWQLSRTSSLSTFSASSHSQFQYQKYT
jgi:hypothetical protein